MPTSRVMASSLGKMPSLPSGGQSPARGTSVRRLTSPLTRTSGLVTGMMPLVSHARRGSL